MVAVFDKIKVSVIIPVYNVQDYLVECLDSIINQTLKDIEIICINDGSKDDSGKILDEYAKKDNRIKVVHKENEGVGITRNKGIRKATGEFVCFMDPDDIYPDNDVLEVLYNKAKYYNVLISGGEFACFTNDDKTLKQEFGDCFDGYLFDSDKLTNYRDYQFDYGYHRFIYDRNFLIKNSLFFPNYKRFQDPPFFVKAMLEAKEFYAVDKITYGYRMQHSQVNWDVKKINDLLNAIYENYRFSRLHKLDKLKTYTTIRFKQHFDDIKNNFDKKSLQIIKEMRQFDSELNLFCKKYLDFKLLQWIFSSKNSSDKKNKIITILGVEFQIKRV